MRFFADACISPVHVQALRLYYEAEGHHFVHLTDKFKSDIQDPDWLTKLGNEGHWIVLSGDQRITTNPANCKAWHESGLTAFFFGHPWQETRRVTQAEALLRWIPRIVTTAKKCPSGHGFHMAKASKEPRQIYPETRRG